MTVVELDMRGARAAGPWLGHSVTVREDQHYPAAPRRVFTGQLRAITSRGLLVERERGGREFVSFVDLWAGHVTLTGALAAALARAWAVDIWPQVAG